jgi:hypothetical protein
MWQCMPYFGLVLLSMCKKLGGPPDLGQSAPVFNGCLAFLCS